MLRTRIYTVCITTLGCVLSHQRPKRLFARNCLPCSSLRRFGPPRVGALTGAPCSISTPPHHATSWGFRRHRHSSVDCLQVGSGSRCPPFRPAWLGLSAACPAATGHPRGTLLGSRLDPLAAGCFPDLPPPKRVHLGSENPERSHWGAIDAMQDSGAGCPQTAQGEIEVVTVQCRARGCDDRAGEGGGSHSRSFRVISGQIERDLSLTCPVSGLDLARRVSGCLDFDARAGCCSSRRARPQERFVQAFRGVRADSLRRAFADLENRQRRKSFVGSNPTPSAFLREKTQRASLRERPPGSPVSTPVDEAGCPGRARPANPCMQRLSGAGGPSASEAILPNARTAEPCIATVASVKAGQGDSRQKTGR